MYKFALLDPRSIPAAAEANDEVFSSGPVYGIKVTVPALAKRCSFNLDPQHSGGDASRTAIEDALTAELPSEGSTLATVRADLDAVGAMTIFDIRASGELARLYEDQNLQYEFDWKVAMVAASDKFARGGWPGPRPLPTKENPWPKETASAESSRPLAAIAAAVSDFRLPLEERVQIMEHWLLTGEEPAKYREQVEKERQGLVSALDSEDIVVECEVKPASGIAIVTSTRSRRIVCKNDSCLESLLGG